LSHTTIVIPCFNEAARLDADRICGYVDENPETRLLLVDDGSTDDTLAIVEALARSRRGRVEVLALHENRGKAEAVRAGIQAALDSAPRYFGYWDADLATPLDEIARFRKVLERRAEVDIVLGSRVRLLGRSIERNASRHYVGRVAATAISMVLGLPVYDTQCGAKLFRATGDASALFRDPFLTGWAFDVEILARLIRQRAMVGASAGEALYEQPLRRWHDAPGSKVKPLDYLVAARDLWRIHRHYLSDLPVSAKSTFSRPSTLPTPTTAEGRSKVD
jgi:glycosyltransferase involved in cell wall biosynthesis